MRYFVFTLLAAFFLISCGGLGSGSDSDSKRIVPEKVDYKIFTNEAEVKRVMDAIIEKAGDNISKLDEIIISVSRPSKVGAVKFDRPDDVSLTLTYVNPKNPKTLIESHYWSDEGKWVSETKTVSLLHGDPDTFVLADEMYDASGLSSDKVAKIVMEAWNKYKDEAKYSEQWVKRIVIKNGRIQVYVIGILAANDLDKTEAYEKNL